MLVSQALILNAFLAIRAHLPTVARSLIATNMDIFIWEEFKHLGQHILEKLKCALLACAIDILANTPTVPYFIWATGTTQVRIGCKGCNGVTRHLNLRNNIHITLSCVRHNFTNFVLSKDSAISSIIVSIRPTMTTNKCIIAICTHL